MYLPLEEWEKTPQNNTSADIPRIQLIDSIEGHFTEQILALSLFLCQRQDYTKMRLIFIANCPILRIL